MLWVIIAQPKKSDFILNYSFDVIVIGAGAAGLMCAIESAKRNKKVLILDHAKKIGEKMLSKKQIDRINNNTSFRKIMNRFNYEISS